MLMPCLVLKKDIPRVTLLKPLDHLATLLRPLRALVPLQLQTIR